MENSIKNIIQLCLDIDTKARDIYLKLAGLSENEKLITFWNNMSEEEGEHVEFWHTLSELAEQNMLPQIFDNAPKIISELENIKNKSIALFENSKKTPDISQMFLIAYRIEFYLLHPAFAILFHFLQAINDTERPEVKYDQHIEEFIEALNTYANMTPEMELIGETLQRLWDENKQLAIQSATDELTGILNRRGFFNILRPLSHLSHRSNQNIGIMMIDIDNFKKINDTHGHQKGDEMLQKTASILKSNIRASDIIGRYGGEEFIIYFSSIEGSTAYKIAEKMRTKVEQETKEDVPITISIGLFCGTLDGDVDKKISHYINRADVLLIEAKEQGKNRVILFKTE